MLLIMLEQLKNNAMVAEWAWLTKSGHGTQKFVGAYALLFILSLHSHLRDWQLCQPKFPPPESWTVCVSSPFPEVGFPCLQLP